MRIEIHGPDTDLHLYIPSRLVLNRIAAGALIRRINKKHGGTADPALIGKLLHAARIYRRTHPEWVLAEILSADGETIRIIL